MKKEGSSWLIDCCLMSSGQYLRFIHDDIKDNETPHYVVSII